MGRLRTIGIVGAYGQTGTILARELARTEVGELLLGGRSLEKAEALAASLGAVGRARPIDVFDTRALREFCSGCTIVVNCAGPSALIEDHVAIAAMEAKAHYVDCGLTLGLPARLSGCSAEIARRGLVFAVSVGYVPGISEVLLRYVSQVAARRRADVDALEIYVVDRNEWSLNSFHTTVEKFCFRPLRVGRFRGGAWAPERPSTARKEFRFPEPFGLESTLPVYFPQLGKLALETKAQELAFYVPIGRQFAVLRRIAQVLFRRNTERAAALARFAFRTHGRLYGSGGVLVAVARGKFGGKDWRLTGTIRVPVGDHYSLVGKAAAATVRLIMQSRHAVPGCNYLGDALDATAFMNELATFGVRPELRELPSAVDAISAWIADRYRGPHDLHGERSA